MSLEETVVAMAKEVAIARAGEAEAKRELAECIRYRERAFRLLEAQITRLSSELDALKRVG